jgi:hypothetical protein
MQVACDLGLEAGCTLKQALHRLTGRSAPKGRCAERAGGAFEPAFTPSMASAHDASQALQYQPSGFRPITQRARGR